ncbi:MAG TPA: biopolymer transporter ExbD [Candidatus Acidoferrales bacterium]
MGMTTNGGKNGQFSDPNIVPLIDVLLVLIIIFMVITPKMPTGLPALIPHPSSQSAPDQPSDVIVVQVMQGGKLAINEEQTDWMNLGARVSDIFKMRADKLAFVKGDRDIPFAEIARAIDIIRGAGVTHVGLMTEDDSPPKSHS